MNREQKAEFVQTLAQRLSDAPLIMLADYRGVTVKEIDALRRDLEKSGLEYKVAKNTLVRRAVEGTDKEGLDQLLTGMTGMIISNDDPISSARTVRDLLKNFKKLEKFNIKGGYFDGGIEDAEGIQKVADLPGRPELLGRMLGTIQAAPKQVLGVIQGPARDLLYVLRNYESKLSEDNAGPEAGG
jgi:large subunit ribosomal protein L10